MTAAAFDGRRHDALIVSINDDAIEVIDLRGLIKTGLVELSTGQPSYSHWFELVRYMLLIMAEKSCSTVKPWSGWNPSALTNALSA